MSLNFLIDSIKGSLIITKENNYAYFIHPFTDGVLPIEPNMLYRTANTLCDLIEDDVDYCDIDYIITPEAMGIPIATAVSRFLDKSYLVARKRKYGLSHELEISQRTGYSRNLMYINGVRLGHRVIIIDDVVSTGGTLKAIMDALRANNIDVIGSYTIIEKDGAAKLLREQGYNVKSLVNVIMGKDCIQDVVRSKY
jgi:adenine phosphoribosyltransferase